MPSTITFILYDKNAKSFDKNSHALKPNIVLNEPLSHIEGESLNSGFLTITLKYMTASAINPAIR